MRRIVTVVVLAATVPFSVPAQTAEELREYQQQLLSIEVDGRPISSELDAQAWNRRTPREYRHGAVKVAEPRFLEIAEQPERARRARRFRAVNIVLGVTAVPLFFGGLLMFGPAETLDLSAVGLPRSTNGRLVAGAMMSAALAESTFLVVRGDYTLDVVDAYRIAIEHNESEPR